MSITNRKSVAAGLASAAASVAQSDATDQGTRTFAVAPNSYPGTDFAQFLGFVRQTDTGNVLRCNPDMSAAVLTDEIRKIGKRLAYVHLKDVLRKPGEAPALTILGQGEIDFKSVFAACREIGFEGPFGLDLETTMASQAHDPRAHHQALLASLDRLRAIDVFADT